MHAWRSTRRLSIARDFRINEQVRAREVRLISDSGEQLGVMTGFEALRIARERNTDLVEVAPTAVPPVCRLMDYGKFKYETAKKEREQRKNAHTVELREIRLRPKIDSHDLEFKARQAHEFLDDGDKVKVSVLFRGREIYHPELARELLEMFNGFVKDVGLIERPALMEGRTMTLILAPAAPKVPKEGAQKEG